MTPNVQIDSDWVGSGTLEDPYRPKAVDDFGLREWSEQGRALHTGPGPRIHAEASDIQLSMMQGDPTYAGKVQVLGE